MASQEEILQKYNYICQFENNIEGCNDKKAQLVLYTKQLLFSNKIKEKYDKLFLGMNYYQCLLDNKEFNEKYKKADKILILGLNPGGRNKEKELIENNATYDYIYNNTKLIFSGMVSGRRIIDNYSKYRLMNTINSVWKEIEHSN